MLVKMINALMKISELLRNHGLLGNDIRTRLSSGQITLNGNAVKQDIVLPIESWQEAGPFLMVLCSDPVWFLQLKLFGLENLVGETNIRNPLTKLLADYTILKYSKREILVLKLTPDC